MMNVLVKWRQISEPNDSVWWIDKLTKASLKEGFGLQTPILSGELKVFRYGPYYNKAFGVLKRYMVNQCRLNKRAAAVVKGARTLEEMWNLVAEDFWVIVPCISELTGENMEGTRLTLQVSGSNERSKLHWRLFRKHTGVGSDGLANRRINDALGVYLKESSQLFFVTSDIHLYLLRCALRLHF